MLWCLWRRRNDKVWEGDMKEVWLASAWHAESMEGSLQQQIPEKEDRDRSCTAMATSRGRLRQM